MSSTRAERTIQLDAPDGLHIRPCQLIAQRLLQFDCDVTVTNLDSNKSADAKQTLQLLTLGATHGTPLRISAVGNNAEAAVQAVVEILSGPSSGC